jgi:ATP-dependent DNA helicase RecG
MIEDLHTEFKESWSDKCLRNVAALGNSDGGTLFIGLGDNGEVVGVDGVKKLLKEIPDKIQNVLGIVPIVDCHSKDGKDYISINVAKHDDILFFEGKVFVKSGSTTRELKGRELRTHVIKRFNMSWTDDPCLRVTVKDLDGIAYRQFKKDALDGRMITAQENDLGIKALFDKLDLSVEGRPRLGAVLLFHPEPQRFTAGACVKIGLFENSDILYQDLVTGPLFLLPDKIIDLLLTKYTASPISFEGVRRVEKPSYPRKAIREALLNSIIHADYGALTPIQIKVFPDRLTIFNDGGPPVDWTMDTLLKSHKSRPGNPSMATVFYRAGMVESFGRGIQTIVDEYKDRNVRRPVFEFTPSEFNVTFFNENYESHPSKTQHALSSAQIMILRSLVDSERSITELMSVASMNNKESFRRHVLKPLLVSGYVEMTIKSMPNSMHQKYRLTSKGVKLANHADD